MKLYDGCLHKAGWPFVGISAVLTLVLFGLGLGWVGCVLTLGVALFFRDPTRVTPTRPGLIVSPADGTVVAVHEVQPEADLGLGSETRFKISIFLSLFNVHVNRMPATGRITDSFYRPGKFVHAASDKASIDNERMAAVMDLDPAYGPFAGQKLGFVQIAGLVARRILCDLQVGDRMETGERYGLIRFGSRADIYLPVGMKPLVVVGQTMIGGETVLADSLSAEEPRQGEKR